MSEEKAREFVVIEYPGLGSSMRNYRVMLDGESMGGIDAQFRNGAIENYFKVIEKSAFDSLQKENEALKQQLEHRDLVVKQRLTEVDLLSRNLINLEDENEALKAKLDRAMTYLEFATLENRSQREAEFNLKDLEAANEKD